MHTDNWRGLYFHSWNDLRELEWQGRVIREIDQDRILVQLFSFLDGTESIQKIVQKSEAERWTFYNEASDMRKAYLFEEGTKAEACIDSKLELVRSLSGGRTEKLQGKEEDKACMEPQLQAVQQPSIEDLDDLDLKKRFTKIAEAGRFYTKGYFWRSVNTEAYWKSAGRLRFDQALDRLAQEKPPVITLFPQAKKKGPGRPSPVYCFNGVQEIAG